MHRTFFPEFAIAQVSANVLGALVIG